MINTPGIQSTGPQGLPGSTSQPAIANEQDEAQFNVMMAQPKPLSSVEEQKAKLAELNSKLKTAEENLNSANQTGDSKLILNAIEVYRKIDEVYKSAVSALEAAASSERSPGAGITPPVDINTLW